MSRWSFTAANISKAVLLAVAVGVSARSGLDSQRVADTRCYLEANSSPDAAACREVPSAVLWDPGESEFHAQVSIMIHEEVCLVPATVACGRLVAHFGSGSSASTQLMA